MNHICPICKKNLIRKDSRSLTLLEDWECAAYDGDHFFAKRIDDSEKILFLKLRLKDEGRKLYLKIDYNNNRSQVWLKAGEPDPITMGCAIHPDFSDLGKLKQKIKTYLLFS